MSIKRGFKQGDGSSCGWFNICIDPLIRNIIADRDIKMIRMSTLRTRDEVEIKSGGYADDVHVLCGADDDSVNGIFRQYERLTRKSGLELNAEKTEILSMHTDVPRVYDVQYCGLNIAFRLLNDQYTILRWDSNPPRQSEVCNQNTALPPSHHGWVFEIFISVKKITKN